MKFFALNLLCGFLWALKVLAIDYPTNLDSESSVEVLGLGSENRLDEDKISKAAQKLLLIYHPDRFPVEKHSESDRATVARLARQILVARDTLKDYVKLNPSFSPGGNRATNDKFSNGSPFSWDDLFKSFKSEGAHGGSNDIILSGYSNSMHGTMFEFLLDYPGLKKAVFPFERIATDVYEIDVLMVVDPQVFPKIELRYLSRARDGIQPLLVKSVDATFLRGHHQGNSGRKLVDAIVLPNGNYLMKVFEGGQPKQPFHTVPMDSAGENLYIQSERLFVFLEINTNGFFAGTDYVMSKKKPDEILPATKISSGSAKCIGQLELLQRVGKRSGRSKQ